MQHADTPDAEERAIDAIMLAAMLQRPEDVQAPDTCGCQAPSPELQATLEVVGQQMARWLTEGCDSVSGSSMMRSSDVICEPELAGAFYRNGSDLGLSEAARSEILKKINELETGDEDRGQRRASD